MSNSPVQWAPKLAYPVAAGLGTLLAAGWLIITDDPAGRLLAAVAVVLLAGLAGHAALVRPRLAADGRGLWLGTWRGPQRWPWSSVTDVDVVAYRRLGRSVRMLQLELVRGADMDSDPDHGTGPVTERLAVLSTLDLGADPRDVADTLHRLRQGAPPT